MAIGVTTALTLAVPAACSRDVRLLPARAAGDGAAGADASADAGTDVGAVASADTRGVLDAPGDSGATMSKVCNGLGDPIRLPTANGPVCASALAARGGRFALCSCSDLQVTAPIHTDSFDSNSTTPSIGGVGGIGNVRTSAAIGCNGVIAASSAEIVAGGALYVASVIASTGHIETVRSLRADGLVLVYADAHVAGDAYMSGSISGVLRVDGVLHVPPGASVDPTAVSAGSIQREAVSVPPPCDCSDDFVDLNAALAVALAANDNGAVHLSMDALASLKNATGVNVTCGVYVLSSIDAVQSLTFAVHGRAQVVVTGDVALRGGMTVTLDPGAELDMVIGGRLMVSGGTVGSTTPARFRIWVASSDSVVFDGTPAVGALIRAPHAAVTASSGLRLSGGLVAGSVMAGGELDVHFDEATLSAGTPCGEPTAITVP